MWPTVRVVDDGMDGDKNISGFEQAVRNRLKSGKVIDVGQRFERALIATRTPILLAVFALLALLAMLLANDALAAEGNSVSASEIPHDQFNLGSEYNLGTVYAIDGTREYIRLEAMDVEKTESYETHILLSCSDGPCLAVLKVGPKGGQVFDAMEKYVSEDKEHETEWTLDVVARADVLDASKRHEIDEIVAEIASTYDTTCFPLYIEFNCGYEEGSTSASKAAASESASSSISSSSSSATSKSSSSATSRSGSPASAESDSATASKGSASSSNDSRSGFGPVMIIGGIVFVLLFFLFTIFRIAIRKQWRDRKGPQETEGVSTESAGPITRLPDEASGPELPVANDVMKDPASGVSSNQLQSISPAESPVSKEEASQPTAPSVLSCPYCGAGLTVGIAICPHCNAEVDSTGSLPSATTAAPNPVRSEPIQSNASDDTDTVILVDVVTSQGSALELERVNGACVHIESFPATIGKGTAADVCISGNSTISRVHARLLEDGGVFAVVDLEATNKTFINDYQLVPNEPTVISDGDELRLGSEPFKVHVAC